VMNSSVLVACNYGNVTMTL